MVNKCLADIETGFTKAKAALFFSGEPDDGALLAACNNYEIDYSAEAYKSYLRVQTRRKSLRDNTISGIEDEKIIRYCKSIIRDTNLTREQCLKIFDILGKKGEEIAENITRIYK